MYELGQTTWAACRTPMSRIARNAGGADAAAGQTDSRAGDDARAARALEGGVGGQLQDHGVRAAAAPATERVNIPVV